MYRWRRTNRSVLFGLLVILGATVVCSPFSLAAEEKASTGEKPAVLVGEPSTIELEPKTIQFKGNRSQQQLLLTAKYGSTEIRDLTSLPAFTTSNPKVVTIKGGVARPVGNGTATITATVGKLTATAQVTVVGADLPSPVSFKNETLARSEEHTSELQSH